jgi:hypothetical protein
MTNAKELEDEVERVWFRRVATVLMVGMICIGALPMLHATLFPVVRTNR